MTSHSNLQQCWKCQALLHEHEDYDTGSPEIFECTASFFNEDDRDTMSEHVAESIELKFQSILFALSSLNNCPEFLEKRKRQSILDARGDQNG